MTRAGERTTGTGSPIDGLPERPLAGRGPVTGAFRARGCPTFRAAAHLVWNIPYGRNSSRADLLTVLQEDRGTCSTKHALLKCLADEEGIPGVELRLGIYEMSERNTPGVGPVLRRHGLISIPEAHCYLAVDGHRIDLTRSGAAGEEPVGPFLHEESIAPAQIGAHKQDVHRAFLAARIAAGAFGSRSLSEVWEIRERCIAALGDA